MLPNFLFQWSDRTPPVGVHMQTMIEQRPLVAAPLTPQMFGNAGLEHMEKYGKTVI